jgi:hypothetical protein
LQEKLIFFFYAYKINILFCKSNKNCSNEGFLFSLYLRKFLKILLLSSFFEYFFKKSEFEIFLVFSLC